MERIVCWPGRDDRTAASEHLQLPARAGESCTGRSYSVGVSLRLEPSPET
jgi:hypothetical protein